MKKRLILLCLIFAVDATGLAVIASIATGAKQIVGRAEIVKICPESILFRAKLDTGADHSSLDASNVVEFERDGQKWVRFKVVNFRGQKRIFEKRLIRYARIKRKRLPPVERPVIRLSICLGKHFKEVEFNLSDRTGFSYKMLIGCSFLEGMCIVDPAKKYTSEHKCEVFCGR
jgi:hypothetical protein